MSGTVRHGALVSALVLVLALGGSTIGASNTRAALTGTTTTQNRGFDRCVLPSTSSMQAWWTSSPYWYYGLYLGGTNFTCDPNSLTAGWIGKVDAQGWHFLPLWVGLQSQCWPNAGSKFSNVASTARDQGAAAADSAVSKAINTYSVFPAVLYVDLEGHSGSATCRAAAQSYVQGWVSGIHFHGYRAGVYGSAAASFMDDFASIATPPDDIWAARQSDPLTDSPYNLEPYVPDGHWNSQQRVRQYWLDVNTGPYGGVTMRIDRDCADGHVIPGRTMGVTPCF